MGKSEAVYQLHSECRLLSIIIPVYNEEENVGPLTEKINSVMKANSFIYEIIFINDGSTDSTYKVLVDIAEKNSNLSVINLRRNFGKAIALDTGFKIAKGDIIITMDGDLQDDPEEIPGMLRILDSGYDLVSGWKKKRHDPWHKTIPSRLFNLATSTVSGLALHDYNCGFKVYRAAVIHSINIYGEMHRYIPALAYWKGFRVTEIEVNHHPRVAGKSKYGIERFLRGLFDFLTIAFITKFTTRPMHFFGSIGLFMSLGGMASGIYLTVLWIQREFLHLSSVGTLGSRPLLSLSVLLITVGMLFFATGLICEMFVYLTRGKNVESHIIRNTYSSPDRL